VYAKLLAAEAIGCMLSAAYQLTRKQNTRSAQRELGLFFRGSSRLL